LTVPQTIRKRNSQDYYNQSKTLKFAETLCELLKLYRHENLRVGATLAPPDNEKSNELKFQ